MVRSPTRTYVSQTWSTLVSNQEVSAYVCICTHICLHIYIYTHTYGQNVLDAETLFGLIDWLIDWLMKNLSAGESSRRRTAFKVNHLKRWTYQQGNLQVEHWRRTTILSAWPTLSKRSLPASMSQLASRNAAPCVCWIFPRCKCPKTGARGCTASFGEAGSLWSCCRAGGSCTRRRTAFKVNHLKRWTYQLGNLQEDGRPSK